MIVDKTVQGIKINYKMAGQGDYIFLLHGWGAHAGLFTSLIELLSARYTVVAPDMPGFGVAASRRFASQSETGIIPPL